MKHSEQAAPVFTNILDMIGNTPMVELRQLDINPHRIFAKLEYQNPGGSIKDRIALWMIREAEKQGLLDRGGRIIEATAGNTGLGLALVATVKGYQLDVVVPDKMSQEKIDHLRALGAQVIVTRSDVEKGHPDYYQEVAERIAKETGAFYVNQFANQANVKAHYESTGPEIWDQMDGKIDAIVCAVGTGGTLTGTGRYLREKNPDIDIVLADPEGSILAPLVKTGEKIKPGSWFSEGIGEDFVPSILDLSLVSTAYTIDEGKAFRLARDLLAKEGLFAGSSSGVIVQAALQYCAEHSDPKRIVVLIPDTGNKYLSKMYSELWMRKQGFWDSPGGDPAPDQTGSRLESLVIHGGQSPEPTTGAVMPPVSLSSTYVQQSPGVHKGFEYSRSHNPTRFAVERSIASLEGSGLDQDPTLGGFAFSSGLAAISTVLELLDSGDQIVVMDDLYGGTHRLLSKVRARTQGLDVVYVDMTDIEALENAVTAKTKMIWVETPTNPTLKVVDLKKVADLGKKSGAITACDNTFATPILQRPFEFGFDLTVHSATKYLGGHSDVVGGLVVSNRSDLAEKLRFLQNSIGSVLGPHDSYLILRGIKTLAIRMERHCENGAEIAKWLENNKKIRRVAYPALPSHPQFELTSRQMKLNGSMAGGGMITFWLEGGLEESRSFLERVQMIALAESLGGVESLIEHPAIMTHASVPAEKRRALGIDDNLCRLSVGIEHVEDLIQDLENALE